MTILTIKDLPLATELSSDALSKIVGGMINLREYNPLPSYDTGGAGYWNPYDGNLLNHPEDDG